MAQPTPYDRQFNFSNQQALTPTAPLPAGEVDNELNSVKVTIDQTLVNLAKIQRDDGALQNGIVTQDSLSSSLSIGFTFRGTWVTATNYLVSDGVSVGSIFYKAKSSHLSSALNQPPNATFWDPIANFTPLAIGADSVTTAAIQNNAVTTPKIADANVTTAKLAVAAVTPAKLSSGLTFGQCRLAKVATNLVLSRFNGPLLTINGVHETIPSAGVTLAATSLTPGTLYYIYAWMNAGAMTLEASTTARATDSTTGTEIKSGDATRTLVGMARPITGPAWQDTAAQRFVVSWFNRTDIAVYAQFTADRTVVAAPFTEVNTEIRNEFLAWSNEPVRPFASGSWTVTGASVGAARLSFDGSTAGFARCLTTVTSSVAFALAEPATILSEGYHFTTVEGGRTGGTNVIFVGSINGNISLTTTIRG